jgi:CRP-like cAMP-binding protein
MSSAMPPFAVPGVDRGSIGDMLSEFFRTLETRDALGPTERDALVGAVSDVRVHPEGDTLIRAGQNVEYSTLLLHGMVARASYMAGGKRQFVAIHVPGDFVDLHSLLLRRLDHDVVALSDVRVALFPHAALRQISEDHAHLTRLLWLLTVIDAAVHREWTARLGHSAAVRMAKFLCELHARLDVIGGATPEGFPLPLTQAVMADIIGLTPVHMNRTLRNLRESGLAVVRDGLASIPDLAALRRFADFNPAYLYREPAPR